VAAWSYPSDLISEFRHQLPSFPKEGIAFHEVKGTNLLTNHSELFQRAIIGNGIVQKRIQIRNPSKRPSPRTEESFQELLHGLWQAESRQFGILRLKKPLGAFEILLGDPSPISRIE